MDYTISISISQVFLGEGELPKLLLYLGAGEEN